MAQLGSNSKHMIHAHIAHLSLLISKKTSIRLHFGKIEKSYYETSGSGLPSKRGYKGDMQSYLDP